MADDAYKKAELRGYGRGYIAGRKRRKVEMRSEHEQRERQAFLDKAFLAALPFALEQSTWKFGEKPIRSSDDRVELAWRIAERSLKFRRRA